MDGRLRPLGYDVNDRKLVVNDGEASIVRMIFERFTKIGSATTLVNALRAEGITVSAATWSTKDISTSFSTTGSTWAWPCTRAHREGAERGEAPRRGDGDPGASAGALASNLLPWWEKLTMDVSLWVGWTAKLTS